MSLPRYVRREWQRELQELSLLLPKKHRTEVLSILASLSEKQEPRLSETEFSQLQTTLRDAPKVVDKCTMKKLPLELADDRIYMLLLPKYPVLKNETPKEAQSLISRVLGRPTVFDMRRGPKLTFSSKSPMQLAEDSTAFLTFPFILWKLDEYPFADKSADSHALISTRKAKYGFMLVHSHILKTRSQDILQSIHSYSDHLVLTFDTALSILDELKSCRWLFTQILFAESNTTAEKFAQNTSKLRELGE